MSGSSSSTPAGAGADATAEPLALTVHNAPQPRAADARTARGRWLALAVLAACAAPVIASYLTFYLLKPQGQAYAALISPPREMPATLPLIDLDGRAVAPASLRGQWLLVAVGRAECGGDCDKRLFTQRQLREMLGRERERIDKVWLVTDDAPVAPALRAALDAAPATRALRVPQAALARWLEPAPGESLDAHLYLVDPMGRWMMRAPPAPQPAKFKRDLDRLLRASASWDKAGR